MEKDIFDIIQEKEYNQLSSVELSELADFCANEDEFLQMKSVLVGVQAMNVANAAAPKPQVKQKLDDLFVSQAYAQTSATASKGIMAVLYPRDKKLYQRPLFQIAAMIVLILGIVPFLMKNQLPPKNQLAKMEKKKQDSKGDSPLVPTTKNDQNSIELETSEIEKVEAITPDLQISPAINFYNNIRSVSSVSSGAEYYEISTVTMAEAKSSESPAESVFEHSDGVFDSSSSTTLIFSKPVSEQPEVLDLLTVSF
jgi:hypothetical protein